MFSAIIRHFRTSVRDSYLLNSADRAKELLQLETEEGEDLTETDMELLIDYLQTEEMTAHHSKNFLTAARAMLRIPSFSPTRFLSHLPVSMLSYC